MVERMKTELRPSYVSENQGFFGNSEPTTFTNILTWVQ